MGKTAYPMDISLKTFCLISGAYVATIIGVLLYIHLKAAENAAALTSRIDDAEKRQSAALGEWSGAMSKHISNSISALAETTKGLQSRNEAHNAELINRHEAMSRASTDVYQAALRDTSAKHENAIRLISEHHTKLLRELAERQESSNKALSAQFTETIDKLKHSLNELEARMAKGEQASRELSSTLQELKKTLEEAVKL